MQSAILLTAADTTSVVQTSTSLVINGTDQHSLYLLYTPGATSNVLTVKVYTDPDGTNWTQDQEWSSSISAGVNTLTRVLRQLTHTAANTTLVPLVYDLPRGGFRMRITYTETTATNGTLTAIVFTKPS